MLQEDSEGPPQPPKASSRVAIRDGKITRRLFQQLQEESQVNTTEEAATLTRAVPTAAARPLARGRPGPRAQYSTPQKPEAKQQPITAQPVAGVSKKKEISSASLAGASTDIGVARSAIPALSPQRPQMRLQPMADKVCQQPACKELYTCMVIMHIKAKQLHGPTTICAVRKNIVTYVTTSAQAKADPLDKAMEKLAAAQKAVQMAKNRVTKAASDKTKQKALEQFNKAKVSFSDTQHLHRLWCFIALETLPSCCTRHMLNMKRLQEASKVALDEVTRLQEDGV